MSGVWNLIHPPRISFRSTINNLLHSGQELYGTVVQHGKNEKTVKVRVSYKFWYPKTKCYFGRASVFMAHDEEGFCVTGDKVVIKNTQKMSTNKYYYVRNIVVPYPRDNYYKNKQTDTLMEELQKIRQQIAQAQESR